jgi:hypothetical protein
MNRHMSAAAHIPRPTQRNPFRAGSVLARQFDNMLKAYANGHRDVIRENHTVRALGNSLSCAFWRGYDATPPIVIPRGTPVWAAYRAGQAQRMIDDQRGVFVLPLIPRHAAQV